MFGQDILMVGNIFFFCFLKGLETRLGECLLRFVPMLALFRSLYTLVKNTHINHSLIIGSGTLALGTARYLNFFVGFTYLFFFVYFPVFEKIGKARKTDLKQALTCRCPGRRRASSTASCRRRCASASSMQLDKVR